MLLLTLPYGEDGKPNRNLTSNNPLWAFERVVSDRYQTIGSNIYAVYNPIKNLTLKSSVSGSIMSRRYNRFDAPNTRRGEQAGKPWGYGYYSTNNNREYLIENTANYNKEFCRWSFSCRCISGAIFPKMGV
jgi:hypothetical protein